MPVVKLTTHSAFALLIALMALPYALADKTSDRLEKRADKIATTIASIQNDEASRIPANILKKAKGVIILRQFEAGLIFGGKGGFGVAYQRNKNQEWGAPAWLKTGEGSWELQIGAQTLNVILLIMNDEGLRILEKDRFRIGVDATVTAGPTGPDADIKIGKNSSILVYMDTRGVYASATIQGGFFEKGYLLPDDNLNLASYHKPLKVSQIISDDSLSPPDYSAKIISKLTRIEKE